MRKKRSSAKTGSSNKTGTPTLFIGCFSFDRPGERDEEGSFQIVVEASSPDEADKKCRRRLKSLRANAALFEDPVTIYMIGFVELLGSFSEGVLINYEFGDAPPPPNVRIGCLIPNQDDHVAGSYEYAPDGPLKEGQDRETKPFVDFGGLRLREILRKRAEPDDRAGQRPVLEPSSFSQDRERREREAARAARTAARAQAQAKRERRAALASTLVELREAKGNARRPRRPTPSP